MLFLIFNTVCNVFREHCFFHIQYDGYSIQGGSECSLFYFEKIPIMKNCVSCNNNIALTHCKTKGYL